MAPTAKHPGTGPAPVDPAGPLRRLTARSAILSVLLGAHPPVAGPGEIVRWGEQVGVAESTVRAALTRMVQAGDLRRQGADYRLADRLVERQRRQDDALRPPSGAWDGTWVVVLVTSVGNDAPTRAALRRRLVAERFAELREGAWLRPDNLDWRADADPAVGPHVAVMTACPRDDGAALARRLFDLEARGDAGRRLLALAGRVEDPRGRLSVVAAIVRHLVADPLLPEALVPADWPTPELRRVHAEFGDRLLRDRSGLGPGVQRSGSGTRAKRSKRSGTGSDRA